MTVLEKFHPEKFVLPCVVDCIDYEKQMVVDVIQHKDQLFKKGDELNYLDTDLVIQKKISDKPIKTDAPIINRLDYRKVRYFCFKKKFL